MPTELHSVPSLESICIEVVAAHDFWIVQKRHLQFLPEHAANQLLQLLLLNGRLHSPALLDVFRHSATAAHINCRQLGLQVGAEWVAYIAGLSHLQSLSLCHATRLKDKVLAPLACLAPSLTHLDLTGCSSLTRKACDTLARLTQLHSLALTDTSIRPPFLAQLSNLTALTALHLGGCEVSDDDVTCHITSFQLLKCLVIWGCEAGDCCIPYIAALPNLQHLNMAWSHVSYVTPLFNTLTQLDLSHCKLEGGWQATAEAMRLVQLRLVHVEVTAACVELLEAVIRSSSPTLQLLDLTSLAGSNLLPLLLALGSASSLQSLSLAATQLIDDYCPALVPCTALKTLDLSQNPSVTADGLAATLPALQSLVQLNLGATGVGDDVLPVLWQLTGLQQLVLKDTAVSWEWVAPPLESDDSGGGSGGSGGAVAAAPAGSYIGSDGVRRRYGRAAVGWQQLQFLDLSSTQLTDAGCAQLAAQMEAVLPAAEAAATRAGSSRRAAAPPSGMFGADNSSIDVGAADRWHGYDSHSDSYDSCHKCFGGLRGLRVLLVGSSKAKLGRKGLAAVARISSLQQLTLQRWQLVSHDLRQLAALQQLQVLNIQEVDPWLLPDDALTDLGQDGQMPRLGSIVREGRQLLAALPATAAVPAAARAVQGADGMLGWSHQQVQQQQVQQLLDGSSSWLSGATAALAAGSDAAAVLLLAASSGSYLAAFPAAVAARAASRLAAAPAGAGKAAAAAGPPGNRRSSRSGDGSTSSKTAYRRLSEYDERYRYSTEQLLSLRETTAGNSMRASQQEQWAGRAAIPRDLRADTGSTWVE